MANKKLHSWIKNIRMERRFDSLAAISRTTAFSSIVALGSMLCSCNDLMHDDLPSCDMGVDLQFKYDYNVQRADMFNDHVGGVSVFVYDQQGKFITRQDAYNSATSQPLKDHNYTMRINLEPGKYRFATFAFQKKYEDALAQPGAKFQIALPQQGDNITALHARLDREQGKVNNQSQPLDTLWQGLSDHLVEVKDLQVTKHTISLVRDTKQLTVRLHQLNEPTNINADDFSYQITDANGYINYDNSLLHDEELRYTPYKTWTTEFKDQDGKVTERTAIAALMFSRVVLHPVTENDKNAILSIWNKKTGEEVVRINLADCLAQGRGAFENMNYSAQEFLDREYDYKLDFFLKGDQWQYMQLGISILDWSKRIQRADL
jgi:hypothetical protein